MISAAYKTLPVPTISLFSLFRMMPQFRRDALATFVDISKRYEGLVRFKGFWTSFLITDPSHVEYVLQTNSRNYRKGRIYKELIPSTGEGLFVTDGEVWRRQRRLAQPAFHKSRIEGFARIMTDTTEEMLERWAESSSSGPPLEIDSEMTRLTLGIVSRALMSRDLSDDANVVSGSFEVIREYMMHRLTSFIKLPQNLPLPRNRRFREAVAQADSVIYKLIAGRRKESTDTGDLLSMLMAAVDEETGETMSDKELRDQALTIIGAGYETTTQALVWTWYLLARHPNIEQKLHHEIAEELDGRTPTFDDLPRLGCTLRVFQEAMRLYPPAWMLARTAIEDDEIGGHFVPANSEVLLLMYATQRDPGIWQDPDTFDPDRFLRERMTSIPRYSYFPFGGGPRLCIGNAFALMEAQLVIATVAQRFRLRTVDDSVLQAEPSVTLRPQGGLKMLLEAR
jgi:cytochrome P450